MASETKTCPFPNAISEYSYFVDKERVELIEPVKLDVLTNLRTYCDFFSERDAKQLYRCIARCFSYFQTFPHPIYQEFDKKDGLCQLTALRSNRVSRLFRDYALKHKFVTKDEEGNKLYGYYLLTVYLALWLSETHLVPAYFDVIGYKAKNFEEKKGLFRINLMNITDNRPHQSYIALSNKIIIEYKQLRYGEPKPIIRESLLHQLFDQRLILSLLDEVNLYEDLLNYLMAAKSNWINGFKSIVDQDIAHTLNQKDSQIPLRDGYQYFHSLTEDVIHPDENKVKTNFVETKKIEELEPKSINQIEVKEEDNEKISAVTEIVEDSNDEAGNNSPYILPEIKIDTGNLYLFRLIIKINEVISASGINNKQSHLFFDVENHILYIPFRIIRDLAKEKFKISPESYITHLSMKLDTKKILQLHGEEKSSAFYGFSPDYFFEGINGLNESKGIIIDLFQKEIQSISEYIDVKKTEVVKNSSEKNNSNLSEETSTSETTDLEF